MKKQIFISILFVLSFNFSYSQVNEQDSLILIEFMNSMGIQFWNTDKQVERWAGIDVTGNRVTGISLTNYNFKGSIPSSIGNLTALTKLKIFYGDLSGKIPESIGNLSALTELTFYKCNLSGEIPASIGNLNALAGLICSETNLTGEIPPSLGKLSTLKTLTLLNNNLSGEIPPEIWNLPNLVNLNLDGNNLTGEIPSEIENLKNIKRLKLASNNFTGEIPVEVGNLENLAMFHAHHNNLSGKIPKELFNCNKLYSLNIAVNNLTDSIPSEIGNLTLLDYLDLSRNDLKGEVPPEIENLVILRTLILYDNQLEACTKLPKNIKLRLDLQNNRFNFNDIEPFANQKDISDFTYAPQDTIVLERKIIGDQKKLIMEAGESKTTYQWFYDKVKISGATDKEITFSTDKEIQKYQCEAKNSLLPDLTLIGQFQEKEEKGCWEAGQLTFCLNSGEWEGVDGEDKIKTTNILSINDFLYFDGTMTIDTTALEVVANGEFYVTDIPLPGGSIGKYTLLEGEHKLSLDGELGKLKDFLNSKLEASAKLFGAPLKIDNLVFVKRNDTLGVSVGSSIQIPGVTGNCGILGLAPIDIAINNLEVTNKGILLGGFSIANLGLGVKDHCLNELTYNYNSQRDILTGGMHLTTPFFENIGGGFKVEKGFLDSIAWELEPDLKPIPLGLGSLGVKGFYGHIATITQPVMDIKLGGIFSDLVSADLYRITASGRTKWPSFFEMEGKGQFLRPILNELPFQLEGDVTMGIDIPDERLWINLYGQFGTLDEETWLIDGTGNFNISLHKEIPPTFSGNMDGWITLPKLSDDIPFSWLNTIFEFPIIAETKNDFTHSYPNLVTGEVSIKTADHGPYSLEYVVDVTKTWYQSGYIRFPYFEKIEEFAVNDNKSGLLASNVTKIFTVPENNEFGVIEIKSDDVAPVSTLTSPKGKKYTTSSSEDNILYSESQNKKVAYWTLLAADAGEWTITLDNPSQNDSIITFFQLKEQEFTFSMNQSGNTVTVSWDVAQIEEGQIINLMLDDDNADFDGFSIAEGDANLGSLNFILDESTPDCNYYLYAQLVDSFNVVESYADEAIDNPLATLAPPENLSSEYNSETGEFDFTWTENPTSEITGYILSVTDELGNDSVYAILNSSQTNISLFIEDFETKSAKIEAYNQDWKIGCPTTSLNLTTSIDEKLQLTELDNKLIAFPNPTTGNCTIRYYVSEESNCEIRVFDIQGREIARPLHELKSAGFHQLNFDYGQLPNGMYIIKFISEYQNFTVKSILSK